MSRLFAAQGIIRRHLSCGSSTGSSNGPSFARRHWGKIALVGGSATVYAFWLNSRNPPKQLPHDPSKKTIAVLGSGWAATSLLQHINTDEYNVVCVSPRNYFLFTPLLPSCTVGTIELRSLMAPIRFFTRFKSREVQFIEANCTDIDPVKKTITIEDVSEIKGAASLNSLAYDYLVVAVGATTATFGIPGVKEHSCFLKEIPEARQIRQRLIDCIESAAFPGQSEEEMKRLLHMVVVGGGPTGVEYAGELHDFLREDLSIWYPDLAPHLRITLIEALPKILPMFHKSLIDYTEKTLSESNVDILLNNVVKQVKEKTIVVKDSKTGESKEIPYGLLVWAAGNAPRPITQRLMSLLPSSIQNQRRGLVVDNHLEVAGTEGIFALGDASSTKWAPTAQVAGQQGKYLANVFNRLAELELSTAGTAITATTETVTTPVPVTQPETKQVQVVQQSSKDWKSWMAGWWLGKTTKQDTPTTKPDSTATDVTFIQPIKETYKVKDWKSKIPEFSYDHWGNLAYIGNEIAIADLPNDIRSSGKLTYLFWQSAYLNELFGWRSRILVVSDWMKKRLFGRDIGRE